MKITVDQIMSFRPAPCLPDYPRERVAELIGDGKTPLEILDLAIPIRDRFWVLFRDEIIPPRELRLMAADFAESVLPIFEAKHPEDKRPREAIAAARKFALGEIDAAACAARAAARDAARAAQIEVVRGYLRKREGAE